MIVKCRTNEHVCVSTSFLLPQQETFGIINFLLHSSLTRTITDSTFYSRKYKTFGIVTES